MNVAVLGGRRARPARLLKALDGKSKRLGVGIDTGLWAQEGVRPRDGLAERSRIGCVYLSLRDRSGRGAAARNVPLGQRRRQCRQLFLELNRLERAARSR